MSWAAGWPSFLIQACQTLRNYIDSQSVIKLLYFIYFTIVKLNKQMFTEVLPTWLYLFTGTRVECKVAEATRILNHQDSCLPFIPFSHPLFPLLSFHPTPPPFHPRHPVGLPRLTAPIMSGPCSRVCVGYVALCACLCVGTSLCVFLPAG